MIDPFAFGVVIGITLSIPVSVLLLFAVTRPARVIENAEQVEPEIEVTNPNVRGYLGEGR